MSRKKEEKLLLVVITTSAFYNLSSALDMIISIMWMFMFALCVFHNHELLIGVMASCSLFSPRLYLPFTDYLLYNVFLILFVLFFIWKAIKNGTVITNKKTIVFVSIMILYIVIVLVPVLSKLSQVIAAIFGLFTCVIMMNSFGDDRAFTIYAKYFIVATISACIYGYIHYFSFIEFGEENRFCGTSSDPNYFGCYLVLTFVMLPMFKEKLPRLPYLLIAFFILSSAFLTGSNTAIIAFGWYYLIKKLIIDYGKLSSLILCVILIVVVLLVIEFKADIGNYIMSLKFESYYFKRYSRTAANLLLGATSEATSGRTKIVQNYLISFSNFSFPEKLIGGHVCGIYGLDGDYAHDGGHLPHSFIIDTMFSIGLIGLIFILFFYANSLRRVLQRRRNNPIDACRATLKLEMLLYSLSLSFFLGFDYMAIMLF